MSPTQARAFFAVAQAGSFTAAAKVLNVSQPTVTTQVRDLETYYGVELFHRRSRGVILTETGTRLLAIIRRMHANQQDAIEYLQSAGNLETGRLRVGSYGPYAAVEIVSAFLRKHPGLSPSLTFANSQGLRDGLVRHELDVGVFTQLEASSEFHSIPYTQIRQVLIVPRDHRLCRKKSVRIKDLASERMVMRECGSEVRRAAENTLNVAGISLEGELEIGSREGTIAAVAQGIGVSLIFDEGLFPEELVVKLPIADAKCLTQVDIVCLADRRESRLIRSFFEVAEALQTAGSDAARMRTIA